MNRLCFLLAALSFLAACKGPPSATTVAAGLTTVDAGSEAGWALTLPRLDGYLRYQRALLASSRDGGPKKAEPTIEERANFDEGARSQAGLSVDDVERIEAMIGALASRRMAARMSSADEPVPLPPGEKEQPTPAQVEQLAKSIATRAALLKASQSLEAERARFGTQNIDVLLLREKELLEIWSQLMGLPAEPSGPAARK